MIRRGFLAAFVTGALLIGQAIPGHAESRARTSFGALDHSIVYDDGQQVILIPTSGAGPVALADLSPSPSAFKRPRFTGWQFTYYDNGYMLGDIFGHRHAITPPINAGEEVYDVWPSPDGQYLAWQFVTSGIIEGLNINMAASRIVITDQQGRNPRVLLQAAAGGTYGDIPIIYGWRAASPPTLLVQMSYASSAMFGLHRGLEEFDPSVNDLVGDYFPPLSDNTLPTGEVLGVSPSGQFAVFATADGNLPTGEGQFPLAISVMRLPARNSTEIDTASAYHDKATKKLPAPRAVVFSRQAFISPDDTRIAYTRDDVLYPRGATAPLIRPIAMLANLNGGGKADIAPDERVMGWQDAQTVVVARENTSTDGLYAVNLNSKASTLLVKGVTLRVDGIVP
ncbi:MAG TPA: hypothetical protein VNL71_21765 [Chloroflexota bacterium]|nr:hypothetical protein [Chloroflexota bacterium]